MRTEPSERWIRGWLNEQPIVDTRAALLFWAPEFPVPNYAYDWADTDRDAFRPPAEPPAHTHPFYGPHGEVTQFFDVVAGDRVLEHAAWTLAELPDRVVVSWQPGVLDRWTEEDEEVIEHPRDPHKRSMRCPVPGISGCWTGTRCWPTAPTRFCCSRPACRSGTTCPRPTSTCRC